MTQSRCNHLSGGMSFFTVTLVERSSDLLVRYIDLLRDTVRSVQSVYPFQNVSWVVMP